MSALADWHEQAAALPDLSDDELVAEIGPRPEQPQQVRDFTEAGPLYDESMPTTIAVSSGGAAYEVVGPGFDDEVIELTYTDRHQLLAELDEIVSSQSLLGGH